MVSVTDKLSLLQQSVNPEFSDWLEVVDRKWEAEDIAVLSQAWYLSKELFSDLTRKSGESYFFHAMAVATTLAELTPDADTVVAALLHDVVALDRVSVENLNAQFGETITNLIVGVARMDEVADAQAEELSQKDKQTEALRKMLMAVASDVRVVLVKLVERLHDMRSLKTIEVQDQFRIAQETLDIYAPLANRLGVWQIKWELEDLSFRYLKPSVYKEVAKLLHERRIERQEYIALAVKEIRTVIEEVGIKADITGRPKHIYSIWRKMQRKGVDFHEIFDVRAVRILVEDVTTCYQVLGIVHSRWRHIPKEFDDYIANPKANNYQSLHTAVIGPEGKVLEVQIRTFEMHEHSELGVAAHWRYKEGRRPDVRLEQQIAWLRKLLDSKDEEDDDDLMDRFKASALDEVVYALTPRGEIIELPLGATAVDFAYAIHTDIGHRCRGALVNGKIVSLTRPLKNGDQVEVLVSKTGGPSRDWLDPNSDYIKTSRARSRVRLWYRQQDIDVNAAQGKQAIEREIKRLNLHDIDYTSVLERFNLQSVDQLFAGIGRGDIGINQAIRTIVTLQEDAEEPTIPIHAPSSQGERTDVIVAGVGDLLVSLAKCCQPVPCDHIIGFITRGRGVTVHRQNCPNVEQLSDEERARLIDVDWAGQTSKTYPVDIHIEAFDRPGLIRDITAILAHERMNVLALNTQTNSDDLTVDFGMKIEIENLDQLSRVLNRLGSLPNVQNVSRRN